MKKIIWMVATCFILLFVGGIIGDDCVAAELPAKYDTRLMYQSPVKDQGHAGLCWAFAGLGTLEASIKKQLGLDVDFSEEHLAYSTSNAVHNDNYYYSRAANACGHFYDVTEYSLHDSIYSGPVLESDDPYDEIASLERPLHEYVGKPKYFTFDYDKYMTVGRLSNKLDSIRVKNAVMRCGAVWSAMHFHKYNDNTGELAGGDNEYYNPETGAYYYNKPIEDNNIGSNHAIVICGWDDNYPVSNFNSKCRPTNPGAWLVKNSWGQDWGDHGYGWISYEDSYFPRESNTVEHVEKIDHSIYKYDLVKGPGFGYGSTGSDTSEGLFIKAFSTISRNEKLQSVKVYTPEKDVSIEIDVVQDLEFRVTDKIKRSSLMELYNGDGNKYDFNCIKKCSFSEAGNHRIELDTPIEMGEKGTKFYIVLKITSNSGENPRIGADVDGRGVSTDYQCYKTTHLINEVFWRNDKGCNYIIVPEVKFSEPIKTHSAITNNDNSSVIQDSEQCPDGSLIDVYKVTDADGTISDIKVEQKNTFETHKERTTTYSDGTKEFFLDDVDSNLNEVYRESTKTYTDGSTEKLLKTSKSSSEYHQILIKQKLDEAGICKLVSVETRVKDEMGIVQTEFSVQDENRKELKIKRIYVLEGEGNVIIPDKIDVFGDEYSIVGVSKNVFDEVNVDLSGLKKLVIGNSVKIIDDSGFKNAGWVKDVVIGKGVEKIGSKAFVGYNRLMRIVINSTNVRSIGKDAFSYISRKAKIYIRGSKKYFNWVKNRIKKTSIIPNKVRFIRQN